MQPRKLKLAFCFMPFGGVGSAQSEHPDIRNWLIPTIHKAKLDPRIDPDIIFRDHADIPLDMVRNELVGWARENGADVLVMIDSDNTPDIMLGLDPVAKPFFETSFNYLYDHYEKGPVVIGAPYCGPPVQPDGSGAENVYVFQWKNWNSVTPTQGMALRAFEREEAAMRVGIEPVAALPTGCIMFDMRAFDLIPHPYFSYEFEGDGDECETCGCKKPGPRRAKCSTEDVVTTRNISLNGCIQLGYNPVLCNWDAWAGHWKPRCVGKPVILTADRVGAALKRAVESGVKSSVRTMHVHRGNLPVHPDDANGVTKVVSKFENAPAPAVHAGLQEGGLDTDSIFKGIHNTEEQDLVFLQKIVEGEAWDRVADDRPLTVVELGSWIGNSALAMQQAGGKVAETIIHCVDHWKGGNHMQREIAKEHDAYEGFCKNVGDKLGKTIIPHRGDTVEVASRWSLEGNPSIDVLFVDAGHTYEECLADIKAWAPHVAKGGVICGHDYNSAFPGVKKAVHEIFGWGVQVYGSVWFARKDAATEEATKPVKRVTTKQIDAVLSKEFALKNGNGHHTSSKKKRRGPRKGG